MISERTWVGRLGTFVGPVLVVLPDGSWFRGEASLEAGGVPGNEMWRGTVTSPFVSGLWDVTKAGRAAVHLPNGWRGEFASPRLEGGDGRTLRVIGYGPAPF